jgi:hypothetical protein
MLGFDLWAVDKKVNNIYKGTDCYNSAESHPVDPSYWIPQTAKIFECYPNIKFIAIQPDEWEPPAEWEEYDNFYIDDYAALQALVDKNK